jgi:hypothetical protein
MMKTIIKVFAFLIIFCFTITGAMAQTWTWNDPVQINLPAGVKYVELSGDQSSETIYGLDATGAISAVSKGSPANASENDPNMELQSAVDLVFGFANTFYVIDADTVGTFDGTNFTTLSEAEQPKVPVEKTGAFKSIATCNNGKLYVLFEVDENEQYLLTGNPPVQDVLTVKLNPQSLNLGSKGNWVTCLIQIPGQDVGKIDPTSVEITNFNYENADHFLDIPIPVDLEAPYAVTSDGRLMVKFVRYNRTTPEDEGSMVGALSLLLPSGPSKGKVDVTATIEANHSELGRVSGEATFKVIVPKAKKQP